MTIALRPTINPFHGYCAKQLEQGLAYAQLYVECSLFNLINDWLRIAVVGDMRVKRVYEVNGREEEVNGLHNDNKRKSLYSLAEKVSYKSLAGCQISWQQLAMLAGTLEAESQVDKHYASL